MCLCLFYPSIFTYDFAFDMYVHMYVCIHVFRYVRKYVYIYIYIYIYIYTYIYIHTCMYACMYVCMYVHMYIISRSDYSISLEMFVLFTWDFVVQLHWMLSSPISFSLFLSTLFLLYLIFLLSPVRFVTTLRYVFLPCLFSSCPLFFLFSFLS